MVVAEQGLPALWLTLRHLVGGTLAAGGANAINMYVDRDIDRLMPRTQGRPLVTGAVTPGPALVFALALEAAAFVVLAATVNLLSARCWPCQRHPLLRLRLHAVAEAHLDQQHRHRRGRRRRPRAGGLVGGHRHAWPGRPWCCSRVIFLWTPPHFWALAIRYADDYRAADVPDAAGGGRRPRSRPGGSRLHRRPVVAVAGAGARGRPGLALPGRGRALRAPCSWPWRLDLRRDPTPPRPCACSPGRSPTSRCCSRPWPSTSLVRHGW